MRTQSPTPCAQQFPGPVCKNTINPSIEELFSIIRHLPRSLQLTYHDSNFLQKACQHSPVFSVKNEPCHQKPFSKFINNKHIHQREIIRVGFMSRVHADNMLAKGEQHFLLDGVMFLNTKSFSPRSSNASGHGEPCPLYSNTGLLSP